MTLVSGGTVGVMTSGSSTANQDHIYAALERMGLITVDSRPPLVAFTGGVSSNILRVDLPGGSICVKQALPRLKVRETWLAPVERNAFEVQWMRKAAEVVPHAVPRILGEDRASNLFAMEYLDPAECPVWKLQLLNGVIEEQTAVAVADRIVKIHNLSAGDTAVAERFANDHIFRPIRLDPYLLATAKAHPDCAGALNGLAEVTGATKKALVHGDVSPKNILVGPRGPVFLDAECAWYGDPAFDLAFCLNHFLLKCVWRPRFAGAYLSCFDALTATYLGRVRWEPREALEARTARLLPGLLLARIDGKSPVEYITEEADKKGVRRVAKSLLHQPVERLAAVRELCAEEFGP